MCKFNNYRVGNTYTPNLGKVFCSGCRNIFVCDTVDFMYCGHYWIGDYKYDKFYPVDGFFCVYCNGEFLEMLTECKNHDEVMLSEFSES